MKYATQLSRHRKQPQQNKGKEQDSFFSKKNQSKSNQSDGAFFQPKLTIGQPGDKYEQEADAMADAVVNQSPSSPAIQEKKISSIQRYMTNAEFDERGTNTERIEEDKRIQEKPEVQRMENEEEEPLQMMQEEEETVQTKAESGGNVASPNLTNKINSSKGSGKKLSGKVRSEMESSFGYNFRNVRVHTDQEAVEMNQKIGAKAFTHGQDVYFNSGNYAPESMEGKKLLAHELTHVVQQNNNQKLVQREPTTITFGAIAAKCMIGALIGAIVDLGIQLGMQFWESGKATFSKVNYCMTILSTVLGCIAAPISAYALEPFIASKLGPHLGGITGSLLGRILIFIAQKMGMAIPKWVVGKLLKLNCISEEQAVVLE